jgi:hypothetical protein
MLLNTYTLVYLNTLPTQTFDFSFLYVSPGNTDDMGKILATEDYE